MGLNSPKHPMVHCESTGLCLSASCRGPCRLCSRRGLPSTIGFDAKARHALVDAEVDTRCLFVPRLSLALLVAGSSALGLLLQAVGVALLTELSWLVFWRRWLRGVRRSCVRGGVAVWHLWGGRVR
jgi:hypothetical protein